MAAASGGIASAWYQREIAVPAGDGVLVRHGGRERSLPVISRRVSRCSNIRLPAGAHGWEAAKELG